MECDCTNFFFQEDLKIYICEECNKEKEYVKTASKPFDLKQVTKHNSLKKKIKDSLLFFGIDHCYSDIFFNKIKKIESKNPYKLLYGFLYYYYIENKKEFDNNMLLKYFHLSYKKSKEILNLILTYYKDEGISYNITVDYNYFACIILEKTILSQKAKEEILKLIQKKMLENYNDSNCYIQLYIIFVIYKYLFEKGYITCSSSEFVKKYNVHKDFLYYKVKKELNIK